jgi:hypothetical protein
MFRHAALIYPSAAIAMNRFMILPLAAALLSGGALHAIPQTVGGTFVAATNNPRNLPVEEWFRDAAHWEAGAKLPGVWITGAAGPNGAMMSLPGPVFGVDATQVLVMHDDKGGVESVKVFFNADIAKVAKGDLRKRLDKAVALFTGKDGKAAGYTVTLTDAPDAAAVTATFTR